MRIPIFQRAAETPWAITEDYLNTILDVARRNTESPEAVAAKLGRKLENTYSVEYRDGVAILEINGPLFRYANLFTELSGATSYEKIGLDFTAAIEDDTVRAILLNIDSPGGEANGTNELAEMVFAARGTKPIVAYVGGMGASGAYWIASAADRIVADQTALLGSIGVKTALIDDSKYMEEQGFREYVIVSSQSPDKNVDASKSADRARVQTIVDDLASVFVSKVARNRAVDEDTVLSDFGQGDVIVGQKAIDAGLADSLGSFEGVLEDLAEPEQQQLFSVSGPAAQHRDHVNEEGDMSTSSDTPAAGADQRQDEDTIENAERRYPNAIEAARGEGEQRVQVPSGEQVAEAAATAERERIAAIMGCDEAKGRKPLAQQLATTAGMTLENAQRILAAQAKGDAGQSWVHAQATADPDVGADGLGGEGDDNPVAAAKAAVTQARESGFIR